jgi:vacuolar protein sorting-associated protein 13A/C
MFEILLESILQKYLGNYFNNLDSAKLSIGVWNGKIIFENLSFSNIVFSKFTLPFQILYSNVSKLLINIPWNKLSSCPVEILLEGVDILVSTKKICICEG